MAEWNYSTIHTTRLSLGDCNTFNLVELNWFSYFSMACECNVISFSSSALFECILWKRIWQWHFNFMNTLYPSLYPWLSKLLLLLWEQVNSAYSLSFLYGKINGMFEMSIWKSFSLECFFGTRIKFKIKNILPLGNVFLTFLTIQKSCQIIERLFVYVYFFHSQIE